MHSALAMYVDYTYLVAMVKDGHERKKPRLNLTFDASLREDAEAMALERGLSLSQLLEHLVREEKKRLARKKDT
jgi:hypothetical protein